MFKESFIYSYKQNLKPLAECLRHGGFCLYYLEPKNFSNKIPWIIVDSITFLEIKEFKIPTVLFYKKEDISLNEALKHPHLYLLNEDLDLYFQVKNLFPYLRDLTKKVPSSFQEELKSLLKLDGLRSRKDFFQKLIDLFEQESSIKSYGFYWRKTSKILGSPFLSGLKLKHLPDIYTQDFHSQRITLSLEEQAKQQAQDYFIDPVMIGLTGKEDTEILCFLEMDTDHQSKALFLDSALNDFYKSFVLKHPHEFFSRN